MQKNTTYIYREMALQEAERIRQIDATCYIEHAWRWNASTGAYERKRIDRTEHELPNGLAQHQKRFRDTLRAGGKAFGCFDGSTLWDMRP